MPAPVSIEIRVDGVDITADVEYMSARFSCKANGGVGEASFRVKNTRHADYPPGYFMMGTRLQLYLDGTREWDGWVFNIGRVYAFDVDDTTNPNATPRYWTITGFDRNLLLQRRFVYRLSDPADDRGLPDWAGGTHDKVVLDYYHEHFVDLSGDDLTFDIDPDLVAYGTESKFLLGGIGMPWGTIFEDCAKMTGATYYIDAQRVVHYRDDMSVTAPFALSDVPDDPPGAVAYREVEDVLVSDEMANDAMVWGAGRGKASPVFARHINQTSIDDHGRWQWADQWIGANRKSTVKKRATTYVEGSANHQRGHGDPIPKVTCTIFVAGIRVGQVVDFNHHVYGVSKNLPVRGLTMTFPTPTAVRFDIEMSIGYDTPFGIVDPWTTETDDGGDPGQTEESGCGGDGSEVTIDEFDRDYYINNGWGQASNGQIWLPDDYDNGVLSVTETDGYGVGQVRGGTDNPVPGFNWIQFYNPPSLPIMFLFRWRWQPQDIFSSFTGWQVRFLNYGEPPAIGSANPVYIYTFEDLDGDQLMDWHKTRISITADGWEAKTWLDDGGEPLSWQQTGAHDISASDLWIYIDWIHNSGDEGSRFHLDYVRNVSGGYDSPCYDVTTGYVFDDANRTIAWTHDLDAWGTASIGVPWVIDQMTNDESYGPVDFIHAGVDGAALFVEVQAPAWHPALPGAIGFLSAHFDWSIRPWEADSWTHQMRFRTTDVLNYFASDMSAHQDITGTFDSIDLRYQVTISNDFVSGNWFGNVYVWHLDGSFNIGRKHDWLADTWYTLEILVTATSTEARIWSDSEARPSTPIAQLSGRPNARTTSTADRGYLAVYQAVPYTGVGQIEIDNLQWWTTVPGTEGDPGWVNGTGTAGVLNEGLGWDMTTGTYMTRYPYEPGTLEVSYNGSALRSGIDFLETDPDEGKFTLQSAFIDHAEYDRSSELVVRYRRKGAGETNWPPVPGQTTGHRVYRPTLQRQYGWGTRFDGENCNMAAGSMLLDRHTTGQFTAFVGTPRNTPPNMRYYSGDADSDPGTSQASLNTAWENGWNRSTLFMGQISWNTFVGLIAQGRGAVCATHYGSVPANKRYSSTFTGSHAIYANEMFDDGSFLIYDPLANHSLIYTYEELKRAMIDYTGTGLVLASFSKETTIT